MVHSSLSKSSPGVRQSDPSNLFCSDLVPVCVSHQQTPLAFHEQTSQVISAPFSATFPSGRAGARAPRWLRSWACPARWMPGWAGDGCCCLSSFQLPNIPTPSLPPSFSTLAHIAFVVFRFDRWLLKSLFDWSSLTFSGLLNNALRDCTNGDRVWALKTDVDFVLCPK